MKKLFFIAYFITCATTAATILSSQAESPVEQLVRIMLSNTNPKDKCSYVLARERKPNDYQDVYNLATKYQKLLKGIIHDGRTFAMLCVEKGHADVLARLINEDYLVDLATPCNVWGPHEPQTTVLHKLLSEVWKLRSFKDLYSEEYIARISELTKLIINKYPDLLDIPVNRARTARNEALSRCGGAYIGDLIPPRDLP